ncbi:hypothetical protein PIB19_05960 [Sphingomonas sp. 7/4-4]|uniref:hypothetical protein n=1 Tax=Sphingomonas sp. 7/4-4 TaxID=3018446 RepID=UPI0022F38909|nr:hypothetical protein [Sphingomonas sp. 7/4-4]WBY08941.1 hypothetical protein PIB19_05960 [Sphingomonas sp. 7/4-4]
MSTHGGGWEPDPNKTGNWRAMFEQPRGAAPGQPAASPPPPADAALDDTAPSHDLTTYKPWLLQRGRSRPSLMLGLRRFEARSGLWQGWGLSYPSLQAVEYIGDRFVSFDFGTRQFVLEGRGLDELARRIAEGTVLVVLEYAAQVWATLPDGPVVTAIRRAGMETPPRG